MKKTLLLTHEYYPFNGGVARYCYNLFKYYNKEKYLIVSDHPEVKTQDNILHLKLTSKYIKPSWLFTLFKLKKIIKQFEIEQIFTPNILPLGSLAYTLNRMFDIPYIISLHGLDTRLALQNKPWLTEKILDHAEHIIINSQNTAQVFKHLKLRPEKIHLLYPGVDFKTDHDQHKLEQFKEQYNINDNDKVLLTVGRLNKRKGQDLVLKAIGNIQRTNLKYFIVGKGELKIELIRLIKYYHLEGRVFILEDVSDTDLIYYYQLADIFVLPNRHDNTDIEGFGMVFLEASACHLSIIAGNSGGVTELLTNNDNALLIDNENIDQLTKAVRLLLNNPDKADKLGEQAFRKYANFPKAKEQSEVLEQFL